MYLPCCVYQNLTGLIDNRHYRDIEVWLCVNCGRITQKGPKWSESVSYQKKDDMQVAAQIILLVWHLLFGFFYYCLFFLFSFEKYFSVWYRRLSFGMTLTQAIRDLFAWHSPYYRESEVWLCVNCVVILNKIYISLSPRLSCNQQEISELQKKVIIKNIRFFSSYG